MEKHASLRQVRERARDTYFVTLKMRSNRRARNTLIPKDVPGFMVAHTTSKILPTITCTHTQCNTVSTAEFNQQLKLKLKLSFSECKELMRISVYVDSKRFAKYGK